MKPSLKNGILAGLGAGVVFGIMMQMMTAPTPDGGEISMMRMVASILGSTSLFVGWVYHLFNSAVIGAIYGWALGHQSRTYGKGFGLGAAYGVFWWILGGLILMPLFLGMPIFAPLAMEAMRPVAWGSLMGHLTYGLILGGGYVWLEHTQRNQVNYKKPATGSV